MRTQTFGIEMETTGLGRERTAKAIAAYFGTEAVHRARHLDDWRVPMPDGRHWTVERDGSVTEPSLSTVQRRPSGMGTFQSSRCAPTYCAVVPKNRAMASAVPLRPRPVVSISMPKV